MYTTGRERANQPLQATPGCALLFFLARLPGAPELFCWPKSS